MARRTIYVLLLVAGAAIGIFVAADRKADRADAPRAKPASAPAPLATSAPNVATPLEPLFNPETLALLDQLQRILAERAARAKEALLTFKDEEAMRRFLERAEKNGLTILGRMDRLHAVRVGYDRAGTLQHDLAQNAKDYEGIAANYVMALPLPPAKQDRAAVEQVPFGNETLAFLGVTGDHSAWGRGTTIAVLDTGVAADPTFGDGRLRTLDIGLGASPGNGRNDGHGTAVAALAAGWSADAPGVAPAANILSIRVTDATGLSDIFTVSQAIIAAVDAGAQVVNVSLGGYATNSVLDGALAYATDRGALIVAAAGNDQAAQLAWPAADSRVVSVGAIDRAEQQVMFSNASSALQLTAPGYGVQTAWLNGQRVYVDGTSASSPLVAGAVAAVLSQNPHLTPQQAAQLLVSTANDGGQPGADPAFGQGMLNVGWAMNRGDSRYIDTAISTHYYDAATNQMQLVVQNRSGQTMSGMTLNVHAGTSATTRTVPSLAPGESYVAKIPVSDAALRTPGGLIFTTQLANPPAVVDRVPSNNRKTTVLARPTPKS